MLRMAHRILSHKGKLSACVDDTFSADASREVAEKITENARAIHETVCHMIPNAEVIICDNVSEYVNENKDEAFHPLRKSLSVTPPFPVTLLEWWDAVDCGQLAMLIESTDTKDAHAKDKLSEVRRMALEQFEEDLVQKSRWVCTCVLYFSKSGVVGIVPAKFHVFLNELGVASQRLLVVTTSRLTGMVSELFALTAGVGFLSLAFMNCKNVELHHAEDAAPSAKWLRRMKHPGIVYKVLNINPFKSVVASSGVGGATGIIRSLHICKGHFEDHTKGDGLFGKHKVVVWKQAHIRGNAKRGIVVKDYKIGGLP